MREYVVSVVSFSSALGLVLLIVPDGVRSGLKKHVRLIGALCLICLLISPASKLLDAFDKLSLGDISGLVGNPVSDGLYDKYEEIYNDYVNGSYGENVGDAVKDALFERFSIKRDNCRVMVDLFDNGDGISEPSKITVVLSGEGILSDPEKIKLFVSELFSCECAVAIE